MTAREKLARVMNPINWLSGRNSIPKTVGNMMQNMDLAAADRILARWPEIKDIVERDDEQ